MLHLFKLKRLKLKRPLKNIIEEKKTKSDIELFGLFYETKDTPIIQDVLKLLLTNNDLSEYAKKHIQDHLGDIIV